MAPRTDWTVDPSLILARVDSMNAGGAAADAAELRRIVEAARAVGERLARAFAVADGLEGIGASAAQAAGAQLGAQIVAAAASLEPSQQSLTASVPVLSASRAMRPQLMALWSTGGSPGLRAASRNALATAMNSVYSDPMGGHADGLTVANGQTSGKSASPRPIVAGGADSLGGSSADAAGSASSSGAVPGAVSPAGYGDPAAGRGGVNGGTGSEPRSGLSGANGDGGGGPAGAAPGSGGAPAAPGGAGAGQSSRMGPEAADSAAASPAGADGGTGPFGAAGASGDHDGDAASVGAGPMAAGVPLLGLPGAGAPSVGSAVAGRPVALPTTAGLAPQAATTGGAGAAGGANTGRGTGTAPFAPATGRGAREDGERRRPAYLVTSDEAVELIGELPSAGPSVLGHVEPVAPAVAIVSEGDGAETSGEPRQDVDFTL